MSGLDTLTQICYSTNNVNTITTIGNFIDTIFTNNASNITQLDSATQSVDVTSSNYIIQVIDQNGITNPTQISTVKKITIADLSSTPKILKVVDQQGNTLICGENSPVVTRLSNTDNAQPLNQFNIGDSFCCGLTTYANTAQGVESIVLSQNFNWEIPNVETATWGTFSCTLNDAYSFIQVCQDYPDQVDPNDINVFESLLVEQTIYAPINSISDVTSTYTKPTLYWIETNTSTAFSSFQLYPTSLQVGYTQPGATPISNALKVEKPVIFKKSIQPRSAGEILREIKITKSIGHVKK